MDQSLKFSTEGKNRFYYRYTEKKLTYNLNSISAIPTVPAPQVVDQEDIKDNNKTFRLDRVVKFIITIRDVFQKKCLEADSGPSHHRPMWDQRNRDFKICAEIPSLYLGIKYLLIRFRSTL